MSTSSAPSSCTFTRACCALPLLLLTVGLETAQCHQTTHSSLFSRLGLISKGRHLFQAPQQRRAASATKGSNSTRNPVCLWDEAGAVCSPTHDAWLAGGPGMPSSSYRRAVLMASAREVRCLRHKTAAACAKDWQMRCFWQGNAESTSGKCASSDMEELLVWSGKGFVSSLAVIPHAMTCPGSPAHSFYECYAFAAKLDACSTNPNCMKLDTLGSIKNVCLPKALQQQKLGDLRQLFNGLENLKPGGPYGSCGAACWLLQAKECSNITSQEACAALPYCTFDEASIKREAASKLISMWDDEDDDSDAEATATSNRAVAAKGIKLKACRHKTQEFSSKNAADQTAQAIYKQCSSATSAEACEVAGRTIPAGVASAGAASRAAAVDWTKFKQPSTAVRCDLRSKTTG